MNIIRRTVNIWVNSRRVNSVHHYGQRSLAMLQPTGLKELDTTEWLTTATSFEWIWCYHVHICNQNVLSNCYQNMIFRVLKSIFFVSFYYLTKNNFLSFYYFSFSQFYLFIYFYFTILYWFCHTLTWIWGNQILIPHPGLLVRKWASVLLSSCFSSPRFN